MQINFGTHFSTPKFSARERLNPQYIKAKEKAIRDANAEHIVGFDGALLMQAQGLARSLAFVPLPRDLDLEKIQKSEKPVAYSNQVFHPGTKQERRIRFLFYPSSSHEKRAAITTTLEALPNQGTVMSGLLQVGLSRNMDLAPIANLRTKSNLIWNGKTGNVFVKGCQSIIELPQVQINPFGSPRKMTTGYKEMGIAKASKGKTQPESIKQVFKLSPDGQTPGLVFALHHPKDNKPSEVRVGTLGPNGKLTILYEGPLDS